MILLHREQRICVCIYLREYRIKSHYRRVSKISWTFSRMLCIQNFNFFYDSFLKISYNYKSFLGIWSQEKLLLCAEIHNFV